MEGVPSVAVEVRAAGFRDPVLIVASDQEVSRLATAWAESFTAAGWTYRVLVSDGRPGPGEIAMIAAEAVSLSAATVVAVGGAAVIAAARSAAAECSLAFVAFPGAGAAGEPATL